MAKQLENPGLLGSENVTLPANDVILQQMDNAFLKGGGETEGTELGFDAVGELGKGT